MLRLITAKKLCVYRLYKILANYNLVIMNWYFYHKYILNNNNSRNMLIKTSNYEIPKNCPYYLLTNDIYVIGYNLKTDYGETELPVYCNNRAKNQTKVLNQLKYVCVYKALLDCNFPDISVRIIMSHL